MTSTNSVGRSCRSRNLILGTFTHGKKNTFAVTIDSRLFGLELVDVALSCCMALREAVFRKCTNFALVALSLARRTLKGTRLAIDTFVGSLPAKFADLTIQACGFSSVDLICASSTLLANGPAFPAELAREALLAHALSGLVLERSCFAFAAVEFASPAERTDSTQLAGRLANL
jgi:hypothetical protein